MKQLNKRLRKGNIMSQETKVNTNSSVEVHNMVLAACEWVQSTLKEGSITGELELVPAMLDGIANLIYALKH